jgi:PilZ domain
MMSEPVATPDGVLATRRDGPQQERRQTPRFRLRDARGSLSWRGESGDETCEVIVMNISGGGAAVLAEHGPQAGQALRLSFHSESARMEPIEAMALSSSLHPKGKQVIRLRFAYSVVSL